MAEDVQDFTVTCPAGTPQTNALFKFLGIPPRVVRRIDWRVPDGPLGVMGFLMSMDGVPLLPTPGKFVWVVANDERGYWELHDYPDSGSWQCTMYNTGTNPHSVYLTFHMDLPQRAPQLRAPLDFTAPPFGLDLSHAGPPLPGRP